MSLIVDLHRARKISVERADTPYALRANQRLRPGIRAATVPCSAAGSPLPRRRETPSIVTVTEAQLDAPGPSFRHEALLYFSDAHFADRVGGLVRAGVVRATPA